MKIMKNIFFRNIDIKTVRMLGFSFCKKNMKIDTFSDQLELRKWKKIFHIFSRAKIHILRDFRSKNDGFQIDQYMLVCPKIEKISISGFLSRIAVFGPVHNLQPSEKCFGTGK